MSGHHKRAPKGSGVLPADMRDSFKKISLGVAVVGVGLCAAGAAVDVHRFAFSYLVGFYFVATIALGGLFFVILQHLVRAGWSVAARRHMEWISSALVPTILLFIPVAAMAGMIWHHWMGPEAADDALLVHKAPYLNKPFFYIRAVFYLGVWAGFATWFYRNSRLQDQTGDLKLSLKMRAFSAPAMLIYALTLTFAAFDWMMSLDPHWYSTIFGVYIFGGAVCSSLSVLALVTMKIRASGAIGDVSTIEHQHDIGKLLFGFVVFWAYIGFSQFMLIYYGNIPEETIWYTHRWEGSWKAVSLTLLFGHFIVPFLMLISRHAKRNNTIMAAGSILLLIMHYLDIYWLVMPTLDHHGAHFSWIDLGGLLGPLGVAMAFVAYRVLSDPAYPLKDPHLSETLKCENL